MKFIVLFILMSMMLVGCSNDKASQIDDSNQGIQKEELVSNDTDTHENESSVESENDKTVITLSNDQILDLYSEITSFNRDMLAVLEEYDDGSIKIELNTITGYLKASIEKSEVSFSNYNMDDRRISGFSYNLISKEVIEENN